MVRQRTRARRTGRIVCVKSLPEGSQLNHSLLKELLALQRRDLDTRSRLLREGRLFGGYAPEMQQVHRENAVRLDRLISEYGWPGVSLVGEDAAKAAWLIAQHAICTPALQRRFVEHLSKAVESGEAPKIQAALLTDRIRFNENKPQVYGTVLDWDEHGELSCEVESPDDVDARRSAVGLGPFHSDLEKHRRAVESEGGRPPADLVRYRQQRDAWARSVGWL